MQQAGTLADSQAVLYGRDVTPRTLYERIEAVMKRDGLEQSTVIRKMVKLAEHDLQLRDKPWQQTLSNILVKKQETSIYVPFIAAALEVPALWLGWGIGPSHLPGRRLEPVAPGRENIDVQADRVVTLLLDAVERRLSKTA